MIKPSLQIMRHLLTKSLQIHLRFFLDHDVLMQIIIKLYLIAIASFKTHPSAINQISYINYPRISKIYNKKLLINNMKNIGSVATAKIDPKTLQNMDNRDRDGRSVIQIATTLVDEVTKLLCDQITAGDLDVDEQEKPLSVLRSETIKIESKTIDIDEHKKRVKKFMMMNKKFKKNREMRSLEMSERNIKYKEESERNREESKIKAIEDRRKQIEKRMEMKKMMMKEIQQSVLETNSKFKQVRKKKFLYQEKEEEFYKKVTLPKIQQQKMILEQKKSLRKPIDMTELFQHEKHYEELKINERLNRSITVRMINEKDRCYSPPQFIPQSFKRLKMEQDLKKQEEMIKKKQHQINEMRKRDYSRKLEEARLRQRQLSKSRSITPPKKEQKEKAKPKLQRQEVKNIGNQYLKQLLKNNKKFSSTTATRRMNKFMVEQTPKRKVRSQYEIEIVKEQRIQKIQTIRNKKIDSIVNDKKMDEYTKAEKLKAEIEKYDQVAFFKLKEKDDIDTINEGASIMMNSIHAKLALLGCNSP